MEKKDCFGWGEFGCNILQDTYCKNEECRFYICKEEYEAKAKETEEKLKRRYKLC